MEHYEIAGYGIVRAMAESLGETEQVTLLTQTLDEEKETDEKLTELAKEISSAATVQTSVTEDGDETKSKGSAGRRNKRVA